MEEEGLLAENADPMAKMKASGTLVPTRSAQLHALLDHFCDSGLGSLDPLQCQVVVGIETPANLRSEGLEAASWPTFNHFHHMDSTTSTSTGNARVVGFSAVFPTVGSLAEAGAIVAEALIGKLSSSISIPREDMDIDKPLHLYGVDCLVAFQIHNWFAKKLGADVAVFATFMGIGMLAVGRSSYKQASWVGC